MARLGTRSTLKVIKIQYRQLLKRANAEQILARPTVVSLIYSINYYFSAGFNAHLMAFVSRIMNSGVSKSAG